MNAFWGALVFVTLLAGAGAALAKLLQTESEGFSLGRGWLLGCAALSMALHIPLAIDGQITQRSFAFVAAVCLAGSLWFAVRCWRDWRKNGSPENRLDHSGALSVGHWAGWIADLPWVGRICVLAAIAMVASHSLRSELSGYDARTAFALKARILYDTGDVSGEDFVDLQRLNFNPTYPLLIPLAEAEMYWFQGTYQAPGLRLLFVGFVLAIASIYAAEIRRFASPRFAAYSALLLLLTPMMIESFEGAGLSGSADLPLCAFVFAGTLQLFRFCRRPGWRGGLAAGLLLGAGAMTKQEGLLWIGAGGLTVLGLLVATRARSWGPALRLAIPGAAALLLGVGLHVAAHRAMPVSPYYPSIAAALTDPHWLVQLADRPPQVARYALGELFRTTRWALLWPCVLGALVLLRRGRVPVETKCWRVTIGIMAAIYLTTMVVSPLHLQYQLSTTFSRLTLHFFPLAMLVMAEQVVASGWMRELAADNAPIEESAPRLLRAAAILLVASPAVAATLAMAPVA